MKRLGGISQLMVFALLLVPAVRAQQPVAPTFKDSTVLPEVQKGARIRSLFEAINSGDRARIRRFLEEDCSAEFREQNSASTLLGILRDTGGVDFYSVRTYTPDRAGATIVIARDRLFESWRGMTIRFGEGPGFLVAGLASGPARPPAHASSIRPEPPLTEKDAVEEARALTATLTAKGWLSGTVLVARGPNVLLTTAAGEASKAYHVPNNIDTKFNLGS